jgi:hypothetical protein
MGDGRVETNGGLTNLGEIAPGSTAGVLTFDLNGGSLSLGATSVLSIEIGSSTQFDQLLVTDGSSVLGGALEVSLLNDYMPAPGDVFTFLTSGSAASNFGLFANVAQNGTILTSGGQGTFKVTYFETIGAGTDRIQLSDFKIVPEPSTALSLLAGWMGIIAGRRRSRSITAGQQDILNAERPLSRAAV